MCPHLIETAWREHACGISGATMYPEDCGECRSDCLPWHGLLLALKKVRLEDLPAKLQEPVYQASLQAADPRRLPASIEREEAAVALGTSPAKAMQEAIGNTAKALTRARQSAAATKLWASFTPAQRAAQVRGLTGSHRRRGGD